MDKVGDEVEEEALGCNEVYFVRTSKGGIEDVQSRLVPNERASEMEFPDERFVVADDPSKHSARAGIELSGEELISGATQSSKFEETFNVDVCRYENGHILSDIRKEALKRVGAWVHDSVELERSDMTRRGRDEAEVRTSKLATAHWSTVTLASVALGISHSRGLTDR